MGEYRLKKEFLFPSEKTRDSTAMRFNRDINGLAGGHSSVFRRLVSKTAVTFTVKIHEKLLQALDILCIRGCSKVVKQLVIHGY